MDWNYPTGKARITSSNLTLKRVVFNVSVGKDWPTIQNPKYSTPYRIAPWGELV